MVANTALPIPSSPSAPNTVEHYGASVGFNITEHVSATRILAFIVPQEVESILSCGSNCSARISDLCRLTFTRLRSLVHPSSVPDDLVFVKFLPVTKHGMYLFNY